MQRREKALAVLLLVSTTTMATLLLFQTLNESNDDLLSDVELWAYQIQSIDDNGAIEALAASRFDMLVIEPTRSDKVSSDFDAKEAVETLHETSGSNVDSKIVIAYVDIGQAEDWRWYWNDTWTAPTETQNGYPDFLISQDPDGWEGNYPVAFWDSRWKDIMLYGEGSSIQQILDDGFDGIYMDWIEAYEYDPVVEVAELQDLDSHQEMIDFIEEIKLHCQSQNPNFLLIAQNALDISEDHPEYYGLIDAVAQEHVLFDGIADTEWGETGSGDIPIPDSGEEGYSTEWYVQKLDLYKANNKIVFVVDYATNESNIVESYEFASAHGFIGFVTQIALSQLPAARPI